MVCEDKENLVLILGLYQTTFKVKENKTTLDDITINDIWPALNIAAANADVVLIKECNRFKVLKHKYMPESMGTCYHISALKNICFARK